MRTDESRAHIGHWDAFGGCEVIKAVWLTWISDNRRAWSGIGWRAFEVWREQLSTQPRDFDTKLLFEARCLKQSNVAPRANDVMIEDDIVTAHLRPEVKYGSHNASLPA